MLKLARRLAPQGVTHLPAEASPLRAAMYTAVGRLTLPNWARAWGNFDWEAAAKRHCTSEVLYPDYYLCNRHGVHGGYLTGWHALGWSFAAACYGLPALYEQLAHQVTTQIAANARILDIGSGTGDWLLTLRKHMPCAQFTAVDLSPYMLAALEHQWLQAGYQTDAIQLIHAAGEHMPLASESYDLVTALLVLHEMPLEATRALFAEARRVLKPGGVFITFDAIQHPIALPWLNEIGVRMVATLFREADFISYAHTDIPKIAHDAGFTSVDTHFLGRLPWKFQIQEARLCYGE
jgi:ubiquinone/menaquinone biosynthesis C-methylase UbiE